MGNDYNNVDLHEQFLKMYLKDANPEELVEINGFLEQQQYDLIFKKVDEYTKRIFNNVDYKQVAPDDGSGNGGGNNPYESKEKEFSTEDMDPQTFELYCILVLIDKCLKEKDENKKRMLEEEINNALYYYRSHERTEQKSLK